MPFPQTHVAAVSPKPLTARNKRFCDEYLIDLNATQAAIRAGYAPANADQQASRLLREGRIMARIGEMKAERAERLELRGDDVVRRLALIAFADIRKLVALHIGPCRYCWGKDHGYQWKTEREYREACEEAALKHKAPPSAAGGFGYRLTASPDPGCPECAGLGVRHVRHACSSRYGAAEVAVFEGLRQTSDGVQLRLADRLKALELLGEHLGVFDHNKASDAATPFRNMLDQLLQGGSKAPVQPRQT